MSVLVTGGAGYIGAHVVRLLTASGLAPIVVGDGPTDSHQRLGAVPVVQIDLASDAASDQLVAVMDERSVDAVIHIAARKQVGESVQRPAWYFRQNVGGLANVLDAVERAGVEKLVFSSSAAVYGVPDVELVDESVAARPINPYGESKLAGEWLLSDAAVAFGLRAISLRYFNVAGAGWPDLGDPSALNLVTIVLDRMRRGERPLVFGGDYPTRDGSGVRDYVHVLDVARAHLAALDHLSGAESGHDVFNVGRGEGTTVREIIEMISRVSGHALDPEVVARRPGDPASLVADVRRIETELGWTAEYDLEEMIASAWHAADGAPAVENGPAH